MDKSYIKYKRFLVTLTDIEWDVGKDPIADGYDLEYIDNLPKTEECMVQGPDEQSALDWVLNDISSEVGFLIQGCKTKVQEIVK